MNTFSHVVLVGRRPRCDRILFVFEVELIIVHILFWGREPQKAIPLK
jgi:hypothetical protein